MSSKVIVGRYELLEKIGDGGMAVVYKANDRLLNRLVAVKILKPEFVNDEKFINNFRKESHAAASLSHTNIVNIYDVGKEGNINYIVMELVNGRPLSEIIKREAPLSYDRVIDYSKQIAAGLAAAHKHGIIHRDVKPHNILINEDGIAKIADFGIAKAVSTTTIVDGTNEAVMGSVHYFSPEQAKGGYVDEKSDIYSLGIVMYEMLTGKVPFDGDNPVSVALMHINQPITPPSRVIGGVPVGLERIVMQCTDKNPSNRPRSAEDLIAQLEDIDLVSRVVGGAAFAGPGANMNEENFVQDEDYEPYGERGKGKKKGKKSKKKKIAIIAAIVAILGALVAGYFLGLIGPKNIEVPDFRGMTEAEAETEAESAGLRVKVIEYDNSSKYSAGEVMEQDPEEGDMARRHQKVQLTVSRGSDEGVVPKVVGMTEDEATELLEGLGYEVKVREVTDAAEAGTVVKQSPEAGERADEGDTVTISVSDGKGNEEVEVPDVVGMSESDAKDKLEAAGFKVSVSQGSSSSYKSGRVISQNPSGGEKAEKGSTVTITVNKSSGTVKLYIDYSDADNEEFYLTVTVSDDNGTRNVISNAKRNKSDGGETISVSGQGQGTITVKFDGSTVMRRSVDFDGGDAI